MIRVVEEIDKLRRRLDVRSGDSTLTTSSPRLDCSSMTPNGGGYSIATPIDLQGMLRPKIS